jgi:hypothetical protein
LATCASSVFQASFAGDGNVYTGVVWYTEVKFEGKILVAGVTGESLAVGAVFGAAIGGVDALGADDRAERTCCTVVDVAWNVDGGCESEDRLGGSIQVNHYG